jgi:hypothetical protein
VPTDVVLAIGSAVLWLGTLVWTRRRGPRTARAFEIPQLPPVAAADDGPVPEPIRLALWNTQQHRSQRNEAAVLNAVVLELADAGLFHIEPADPQRPAMVSPRVLPHASQLPPYQASVVARLLHRRGVSQQPVPLTALQPGEDDKADRWYKDFARQIREAATDRGLLQPPVTVLRLGSAVILGFLLSDTAATAIADHAHMHTLKAVLFFVLCAPMFVGVGWACQVRPTGAGRELLAETAESAPQPVPAPAQAPQVVATQPPDPARTAPIKVLPDQTQPLPKHQIWSEYGGEWHPLDIESKETYTVRTGAPAAVLPAFFAALSIGGLIVSKQEGTSSGVLPFAVFGALPLALLVGAGASSLRRRNLPKRAVIRGQVAKLWTVKHGSGESETTYYYCVLDVGRAPASVRLKANRALYGRLQVGMEIEVLVNPRARRIKDVHFAPPAAD